MFLPSLFYFTFSQKNHATTYSEDQSRICKQPQPALKTQSMSETNKPYLNQNSSTHKKAFHTTSRCAHYHSFLFVIFYVITLFWLNIVLSQRRFWICHENELPPKHRKAKFWCTGSIEAKYWNWLLINVLSLFLWLLKEYLFDRESKFELEVTKIG